MGDVLDFPTPKAQGLAFLEAQLRDTLSARGADEQLIDYATEQLLKTYQRINESEQYSFSVRLPEGLTDAERTALQHEINAGLESVRQGNHALMLELVAQLVLTQVQLFQHQRD